MLIEINDKIYNDIDRYCELNDIRIGEFIENLLKKSFTIEKYGDRPNITSKKEKNEPIKEGKTNIEVFPKLEDVEIDFSKQEELKPEIPMTPDNDFIKEVAENLTKTPIIDEHRVDVNEDISESTSSNIDEQPKKKLKRKLS